MILVEFVALVSCAAITISISSEAWRAKSDYWKGVAELCRTLPSLTATEKDALRVSCPEIGYLLGVGEPTIVLAETPVCPADFFIEFLGKSNPQTTWAKRDIDSDKRDSREVRRRMWDDLCHFLYRHEYLISKPAGQDSWLWRPGAWRDLHNKFVGPLPNLSPDKLDGLTNVYQAEVL